MATSRPATAPTPPARHDRFAAARFACNGALLTIGVYVALLGPALPDLTRRAGVPLGDGGALFTAIFAASILSTIAAGRALDRFGHRPPLIAALVLHGAALLLMPLVQSWTGLLAVAALLGLGDGALVVCAHILVAHISPRDEAAALNRLNVYFGVGAVLGASVAGAAAALDVRIILLLLPFGLLQFGYAVVLATTSLPSRHRAATGTRSGEEPSVLLSSRLLWLLAVLLLVYVGVEVALGGWAFTYARQSAGLSGTAAAVLSGGYWAALTLGRLVSPLALRRGSPEALLVAAPLLSAAAALALVLGGDRAIVLVAGVLVAGFGFGPVWPVTFALAARAFPASAGSAAGLLGMVSAVGGVGLPWMQGRVLAAGGPAAGIAVTLAGCLIVAALAVAVRRESIE